MSTLTNRKEQLQKELNQISVMEQKEIIEKHYPEFKNKYEGKYFKTLNRYGGDTLPWFMYTKVTLIRPQDVYDTGGNGITAHYTGWTFQIDTYGKIDIENKQRGYVHNLSKQITETEFNKAWNKMITKINSL